MSRFATCRWRCRRDRTQPSKRRSRLMPPRSISPKPAASLPAALGSTRPSASISSQLLARLCRRASARPGSSPTVADTDFDVVIVGAGPAGSCAAIEAARGGLRTLLLERGPYPGSKNMYGGVVYPRILDELIPEWWTDVPIQRWVTRRSTMVLTE